MFDSLALLRDLPDELKVYPGHACAPPRLDSQPTPTPPHSPLTPLLPHPTPTHSTPHLSHVPPHRQHSNSHPPTPHARLFRLGASGACARCACTDGGASTTIGREKQAGLLRPISKQDFLRMFAR